MATTDKYDRQLRLWGANGQRQLMSSHILLIHANGVGSETLKNLVLPGIGNFTILDDYIVNQHDLSNNFFVSSSSVGKPRAEVRHLSVCLSFCLSRACFLLSNTFIHCILLSSFLSIVTIGCL
jgi:molybdopterin/thiamine biosynthesis adenylyltransferase